MVPNILQRVELEMLIRMENVKKTFEIGFEEFLRYCSVRDYTESTISNHKCTVKRFNEFFSPLNLIETINSDTVEEFIYYLRQNSSLSNVSISMHLKNLCAIFNYFHSKGYMSKVWFPRLKFEKKVKETYTDEELRILLVKPKINKCKFAEYRNWVIINYLLSTGNRRNTILNLKIGDIDFDSNLIKLEKMKNKKQQFIPLSNTLSKILAEYLHYRKGSEDDYLFCDSYGAKLETSNFRTSFIRYHKSRGLEKSSIHLYRHTFAKKWILSGGDVFRLQKMLGHSSLNIVRQYVEMFDQDLQHDFDKFNALDQLNIRGSKIQM